MSDAPDWFDRRHWIEYDSAVALRYHARRRDFIDRLARLDTAMSLILGSAAFGTILSGHLYIAAWTAALSAAFSATDIAFGLSERARLHDGLCRRWSEIRAKLVRLKDNDTASLQELEVERTMVDADSPDQKVALSYICENDEKESRRSGPLYNIGPVQRALADWITLPWWKPEQAA